eukprot:g34095.t1
MQHEPKVLVEAILMGTELGSQPLLGNSTLMCTAAKFGLHPWTNRNRNIRFGTLHQNLHDDGIAAAASVLNTTDCQFPDAILQLIRFILKHNIFTFDNQFFVQTHGTATGTRFAPQYASIFMHKYIDGIFFVWTHGKELLKQLHSDINKFHPTIRLTMDY